MRELSVSRGEQEHHGFDLTVKRMWRQWNKNEGKDETILSVEWSCDCSEVGFLFFLFFSKMSHPRLTANNLSFSIFIEGK